MVFNMGWSGSPYPQIVQLKHVKALSSAVFEERHRNFPELVERMDRRNKIPWAQGPSRPSRSWYGQSWRGKTWKGEGHKGDGKGEHRESHRDGHKGDGRRERGEKEKEGKGEAQSSRRGGLVAVEKWRRLLC